MTGRRRKATALWLVLLGIVIGALTALGTVALRPQGDLLALREGANALLRSAAPPVPVLPPSVGTLARGEVASTAMNLLAGEVAAHVAERIRAVHGPSVRWAARLYRRPDGTPLNGMTATNSRTETFVDRLDAVAKARGWVQNDALRTDGLLHSVRVYTQNRYVFGVMALADAVHARPHGRGGGANGLLIDFKRRGGPDELVPVIVWTNVPFEGAAPSGPWLDSDAWHLGESGRFIRGADAQ